jgi:hypothetical protein
MRSQIDAKLDKPYDDQSYCCRTSQGFFNLFLNPDLMSHSKIECWVDNIKPDYNNETKTTSNTAGVETIIPGFGDPEVVEHIDPNYVSFVKH